MANFTNDIKNEIISNGIRKKECKRAALSALFRVNGELSYDFLSHEYGMDFVTESEETAEFFCNLVDNLYGAELKTSFKQDKLSKKEKFRFSCGGEDSKKILIDLGVLSSDGDFILKIEDGFLPDKDTRKAFVLGAFVGGGSCTVPNETGGKTGFHLQVSFRSDEIASNFAEILSEFEILTKTIEYKGSYIVYVNSKETISDFISLLGAENALNKFSEIIERRDSSNNENRTLNCRSGNLTRSKSASDEQCSAIEFIMEKGQFEKLAEPLKKTAECRLAHKDYSLQQIADALNVTKSCASHRLKKLMEIYDYLNK